MSDNPSRLPFYLDSPSAIDSNRQFSLYVSRALDCLGKSKNITKFRVECNIELERNYNNIGRNTNSCIIAGSKGEGLTAPFENDYDIMSVSNIVICVDNTAQIRSIPAPYTVFETDRGHIPPGYTKLKIDQRQSIIMDNYLENSLLEDGNRNSFLSSDFYIKNVKNSFNNRTLQTLLDISGPSIPSVGKISQDFVLAFTCVIPELTQSFITRHRNFGWPTNDQLTELSTLEGHVVPVGYKGSQTAFLEWRICFTKSERFLMRSLNDMQTKTYVLLKMVTKTYIKCVCKEITSYVLKNIVLWQAECGNLDTFNEASLVNSLIEALIFLRKCIINHSLPSYMIPERNLLSLKLDLGQRQQLVILLTELINKGGGLLMGCERIRVTMSVLYKAPALAEQYRWKRDMIEKLFLWLDKILKEKQRSCATVEQMIRLSSTDSTLKKIMIALFDLIIPDFISLALQGHEFLSIKSIQMERLKQWLS